MNLLMDERGCAEKTFDAKRSFALARKEDKCLKVHVFVVAFGMRSMQI